MVVYSVKALLMPVIMDFGLGVAVWDAYSCRSGLVTRLDHDQRTRVLRAGKIPFEFSRQWQEWSWC